MVNTSSDVQQLPMVLNAVKANTGSSAVQVLADAGYRSEAVMAELAITQPNIELVIALGREAKVLVKPRDARWIKNVLGFRQFSMRGLQKAQAEFKLVSLALNLRRMGAMAAN